MRPVEYETMRALEDYHWWYSVLRRLAMRVLVKRCPAEAQILDAGCGTGGTLAVMRAQRPNWGLHGIDLEPMALAFCRERSLMNVARANVARLPFGDDSFDAVLCLDVLYHASVDQSAALAEMTRVLRPGGTLVLNLPAFEFLRGTHDVAVCGARRYTSCHVRRLLQRHNLEVEMIHYWNAWLFMPLLIWRRLSRKALFRANAAVGSDLKSLPPLFNALVEKVGWWDASFCRWTRLPFGTSVFAEATKPHHGRRYEN